MSKEKAILVAVKYLLDFSDSTLMTECQRRIEAAQVLLKEVE